MSLDVFEEIQNTYPTALTAGKLELFLNVLHPGKNESVPDPWYGVKADYATVYNLIAQACACILKLPTDAKK
jgi:protein-tyrosine phosphatase